MRVYCLFCGQALWHDFQKVLNHYEPIFLDLAWRKVEWCPRCGRRLGIATVTDISPAEPLVGG